MSFGTFKTSKEMSLCFLRSGEMSSTHFGRWAGHQAAKHPLLSRCKRAMYPTLSHLGLETPGLGVRFSRDGFTGPEIVITMAQG